MKKIIYFLFSIFICIFFISVGYAQTTDAKLIEQGNYFLKRIENNDTPELKAVYIAKAQYYFYVASKSEPPSTTALVNLGKVYILQDRYSDAKKVLFQAYSIDKFNADANFEYAQLCFKTDNYEEALKYYNNALKYNYKDSSQNNIQIAKCYEKLGDLEKALEYYQKVPTEESAKKTENIKRELENQKQQQEVK